MSHFRRSNFGRFSSTTANEHHQRQLTAPVNKWKKQWVSPTGLAPESSYKICKWVKQKEKAKLTGAIEVDDNTPVPEGEENEGEEHEEDQDMEEDDQEQGEEDEGEGENEEGEGEGEGDEDTKGATGTAAPDPAQALAPSESTPKTSSSENPIVPPTSIDLAPKPSEAAAVPPTEPQAEGASSTAAEPSIGVDQGEKAEPSVTAQEPTTVSETVPAPAPAPAPAEEEDHEATIPAHEPIPSNATEITPIGPSSTESGLGTIATNEPTVEIDTRPAEESVQTVNEDEKMDVEDAGKEGLIAKQVEEDDKGLIHGEMDPPTEALEVENPDVPKEVEKE